ncbi:helix-turn-helix transcriptional regulator [Marinobacter shengliensis]|uniref:helix-turn-helix transcriptional regulator n=1 Tax=Marinobacter shengliensis TaxID=1389223 RepID=UPI001E4BEDE2|nr:helix-turn-helix transcriptional regulator [Marinobacter shengliensis]MCD1628277.1 helix-turn-helix transcriptional regulator [Marinobacter shengliensis]
MQTFTATEFTACNLNHRFTNAELETLAWMAEGKENSAIGLLRGHGEPGAKKLVSSVLHKLDCNNRCLAISRAFATGYLKATKAAKKSTLQAIAALLIIVSGVSAGTGSGDSFLRTASSRSQGTYRVRWEEVLPANHGGAA